MLLTIVISIHALRGEGDVNYLFRRGEYCYFNPRPPWGGRQKVYSRLQISLPFQSTPSVGRATKKSAQRRKRTRNFNPRPPWGGRQPTISMRARSRTFQSTPSVGRATYFYHQSDRRVEFQSTPSVGRATSPTTTIPKIVKYFNPRPPWGGRLCGIIACISIRTSFQSTPSVGRATKHLGSLTTKSRNFNPRPPWGGRQSGVMTSDHRRWLFQSTPSVGRATNRRPLLFRLLPKFQSTPSVGRATALQFSVYCRLVISIHALRGEGDSSGSNSCRCL